MTIAIARFTAFAAFALKPCVTLSGLATGLPHYEGAGLLPCALHNIYHRLERPKLVSLGKPLPNP